MPPSPPLHISLSAETSPNYMSQCVTLLRVALLNTLNPHHTAAERQRASNRKEATIAVPAFHDLSEA